MALFNQIKRIFLFFLFVFVSRVYAGPPNVTGIHHVKVPVFNINTSFTWYTRVMGAKNITTLDHINSSGIRYAVELEMPSFGKTVMELRLDRDVQLNGQKDALVLKKYSKRCRIN
jgi:hypothetical protein